MLKRDPKGRFIWKAQALKAWLPTLLEAAPTYDNGLTVFVLECLARFCDKRAGERFKFAAVACDNEDGNAVRWCEAHVKYGQQWMRRAAIIRKASKEIKAEVA